MPKRHDAAVRERAVRMVREQLPESGGSLTGAREPVSARLGLSKETVLGWVRQAEVDCRWIRVQKTPVSASEPRRPKQGDRSHVTRINRWIQIPIRRDPNSLPYPKPPGQHSRPAAKSDRSRKNRPLTSRWPQRP